MSNEHEPLVAAGVEPEIDPDAPVSHEEHASATAFADYLDAGLAGATPPAVLTTEHRALLETTVAMHSVLHPRHLATGRMKAIVEAALLHGLSADEPDGSSADYSTDSALAANAAELATGDCTGTGIIKIGRSRALRALPWVSAVAAAAAAVFFFFFAHPSTKPSSKTAANGANASMRGEAHDLAAHLLSRSADELIGPIERGAAANASSRIDAIFADRMNGYRELSFRARRGVQ